jgi:regulatory protein
MRVVSIHYDNDAVRIELDEGEPLLLPVLVEYQRYFSRGVEIEEDDCTRLREVSENYLCTRQAILYLSRGVKSEFQLSQYLRKKKYPTRAVKYTIDYLREKKYLDDGDYAHRFIADLTKRKKVGTARLRAALAAKGIAKTTAEQAIKDAGFEESWEDAYEAAVKKFFRLGRAAEKEKVWRFLYSRGFKDNSIRKAVQRLEKENLFPREKD